MRHVSWVVVESYRGNLSTGSRKIVRQRPRLTNVLLSAPWKETLFCSCQTFNLMVFHAKKRALRFKEGA